MRDFYSQDGEAEILTPAMDENVQLAFKDARTDFAKGPPSATGIHQSWDRNTSFRDCKKGIKTVAEGGVDTSNPTLSKNMKKAINEVKAKQSEVSMTSAVETKMIKAAEVISFVQKNGYVTARKHAIGYEVKAIVCKSTIKEHLSRTFQLLHYYRNYTTSCLQQVCGQHVKPSAERKQSVLGFEHATVCLKTIMDQCYTPISPIDEQVLLLNAPEVIRHIRTEGCVTDLFLDSIGIPKLPDGRHIDRDGLVPWRRHAYMMSHAYSRADFIDYIQIRNDNNDPLI